VRNACGKKNPEIQKTGGGPDLTQRPMNSSRSTRSDTHAASGLRDGYAFASHNPGTLLPKSAVPMSSSSRDMTTRPVSARWMSESELAIAPRRRL
jgi:hypothetical protein